MGAVRTVPEESQGRQPVPGSEKMQDTLAWQWASKIAKPSSTRLEYFKNILTSLKISWELSSSSDLKVKPVPQHFPSWLHRQKNIQVQSYACEATWEQEVCISMRSIQPTRSIPPSESLAFYFLFPPSQHILSFSHSGLPGPQPSQTDAFPHLLPPCNITFLVNFI